MSGEREAICGPRLRYWDLSDPEQRAECRAALDALGANRGAQATKPHPPGEVPTERLDGALDAKPDTQTGPEMGQEEE